MNSSAALKRCEKGQQVQRESWHKNEFISKSQSGDLQRTRNNGRITIARLDSNDLLADDWKVRKIAPAAKKKAVAKKKA